MKCPRRPSSPLNLLIQRADCLLSSQKEEREELAEAMLNDVVTALINAGCSPFILSTVPLHCARAEVKVCDRELNSALNTLLESTSGPLLIIMADLPLVTPEVIRRLISTPCDIAFGPGRGGGTNAIFIQDRSRFHVDYYGASYLKHRRIAEEAGLSCDIIDSYRLHTDVDEEDDLVELFIHGEGNAAAFLKKCGFVLSIEKGRVGVIRKEK